MVRVPLSSLASLLFLPAALGGCGQADIAEWDFVVVGGGTAGITLAARLAENSFKVALVEAGGYYELQSLAAIPAATIIPVGSDPNIKSPIDWGFVIQGMPGTNYRDVHYARGKCMGGSSALNFMIYQRPTRESMHMWATTVNDSSYEFDALLPYFKRSVRFTPPNTHRRATNATPDYNPEAFDSAGGPLHVSYSNYATPWASWVKLGMEAIGIPETEDFNSGRLGGGQYTSITIRPKDQTRSSSESAFLGLNHTPGLTIFTNVLAKNVIFDQSKRAVGVEVKGPLGHSHTLRAKNEVILSAGAFQSPQILMLSGIGPACALRTHGIPVLVDLVGVGQNMWDHVLIAPSYRVKVPTFTSIANNILRLAAEGLNQIIFKDGPFTSQAVDFLAWEKIPQSLRSNFSQKTKDDLARFPSDWPEAEYLSASSFLGNVSNPLVDQPKDGYEHAAIAGTINAPSSRGSVTLKSANPEDLPIVSPNWLSARADQELAIAIVKRIREAFESPAMADVLIGDEYFPGKAVQSDEQILEYVKDNIMTIWHAACTCKMGTSQDPLAVVDSKARVFGVTGLRVVDASSFAILPPGHPQAMVYALAEKIARDIISSHPRKAGAR